MLFDVAANRLHQFEISVAVEDFGLATQTCAVAGLFGGIGRSKEGYVASSRMLGRTRWTAIDPGGRHREYKSAVLGYGHGQALTANCDRRLSPLLTFRSVTLRAMSSG